MERVARECLDLAHALGMAAYMDGKKRVPAWDKRLMDIVGKTRMPIADGGGTQLYKAWLEGYEARRDEDIRAILYKPNC